MPPVSFRIVLAGIATTAALAACTSFPHGTPPDQSDPAMHGFDDVDRHPTWSNCQSRCVVDGRPRCCETAD
ncbi:hypothetical protein [Burkholderia plantarii]|uniref:hypothetical protein n=1 Tax=Burkholderia plantarii TaxID=41899 RepID=UPI0006D89CDB|nr:hypothetical protein [Burkholderia plantarii]GLZ20343.1 hypothetical protein Bpla01_38720 [Burkholderia plantarii]